MFEYRATCLRVVDGDTLDLDFDLGLHIHVHERVRLAGINTPETYGVKKDSDEYRRGLAAKQFLSELVEGKELTVSTEKDHKGKYGRYLATIVADGRCVNDWLVEEGHAERVEY